MTQGEKKESMGVLVSTIREGDKKNRKYYTGDFQFSDFFELIICSQNNNDSEAKSWLFNDIWQTIKLIFQFVFPSVLCILTSEQVLHMPFAGQNRLSDAKTTNATK